MRVLPGLILGFWALLTLPAAQDLTITMVGNAGVLLTDGQTSLLVDLPYESGAFGYMTYEPLDLRPAGRTVSVITHHHRDHFDPDLFGSRRDWRLIGPPSVTDGLPEDRVIEGDSVRIGAFTVVTIPTPHSDGHRSYRVRWSDTVLHFVGDTEDPEHLRGTQIDVLFITPWLSCLAAEQNLLDGASRRIAYHLSTTGDDRICGQAEILAQGATFSVEAPD